MNPLFKQFKLVVDAKSLEKGQVRAVFATMGVVDKDGDVTLPGFFGKQNVVIVPTHDWSSVPLGKGVTSEEGNEAIVDFQFNLELQAAKDWLSALKFDLEHGEPVQEWSYGFKVLDGGSSIGDFNGRQVRYLQPREDGTPGSKIWEVSPVLVGAGEKTRTLVAKGAGMTFCDEADAVLAAADGLVKRGQSLADLRAKEGRDISVANQEKLAVVATSLTKAAQEMAALIVVDEKPSAAKKELARMLRIRAGVK